MTILYKMPGAPSTKLMFGSQGVWRRWLPTPRHQLRPREFVEHAWLCGIFAVVQSPSHWSDWRILKYDWQTICFTDAFRNTDDVWGALLDFCCFSMFFQHRRIYWKLTCSFKSWKCPVQFDLLLYRSWGASDLMWSQSGSMPVLQERCFGLCGWHPSASVPCLPGQR